MNLSNNHNHHNKNNYFKQKVLTIAGSDCSGGAGIQADLKTFTALGCYGMSVITAITAQNTQGVFDVFPIPLKIIESQLNAIFSDIKVNTVKIGMIYDSEIINLVSQILTSQNFDKNSQKKIVLDPVMIAKSGSSLFKDDALITLKE
jgi:hydroxymethylpyrimidine/phosphomethylpyrimidine kinase